MKRILIKAVMSLILLMACWCPAWQAASQAQPLNPTPPSSPVRLVFIHHSVGENLLNAGLFAQLNTNNYYVTDTYYGWPGAYDIGSFTDIGQWYNWFLGPSHQTYLTDLYNNTFIHEPLTNSMPQPASPNTVVLFKSCFPNSAGISGNPDDPPRLSSIADPNPIWGANATDPAVTVANIKGLYRDLLTYFATRQDKLFILLTPPPVRIEDQTVEGSSNRARAINTWLVNHWLDGYPYNNVAVFDFFNVLTSNGGDAGTNDLGAAGGNHHRLLSGRVQHQVQSGGNLTAYPSDDSHPTAAGSLKGAGEFVPLLNVAYHAWQGTGGRPFYMGRGPRALAGVNLLLFYDDLGLTSSAFANRGLIPDRYTLRDGVGQNLSIPLTWSTAPAGTRSFALSMVDLHPDAGNFVHWLAINLPPSTSSLAEGATLNMPAGTIQLNNSWDDPHYGGPSPPPGSGLHPYEITVYALNTATLELPVNSSLAAFQAALAGRVLDQASITGYYRID